MSEISYPFTITAAQLNVADTADQALNLTWVSNSRAVRIPKRLEITRDAGTAYTIGSGRTLGSRQNVLRQPNNYADFFSGGKYLVFRDDGDGNFGTYGMRGFFWVPLEGFIDRADANSLLVFPYLDGQSFKSGATGYKVRSSCTISGGTGTLTGRVYFDEYFFPEA